MTLAEHIEELWAERAYWLAALPSDMPRRADAARKIEAEIDDAVEMMRRLGITG